MSGRNTTLDWTWTSKWLSTGLGQQPMDCALMRTDLRMLVVTSHSSLIRVIINSDHITAFTTMLDGRCDAACTGNGKHTSLPCTPDAPVLL